MQTYAPDRVVSLNERSAVRRAPTGPSVYVATAVAELPRVEGAWRALQGGSHAGVFAGYEWSSTVARHYARDRRLHIALASHSGTPVGLAPLAYRQYLGIRTLALLGSGMADYSIADYQDIFLRPGFEQQALTSLVDDAAQAPWDLLWLQEIPAESPVLEYLPDIARDRGWRVVVNADNDVHRIDLPATWDDFTGGLSSNCRKEIRTKLRRLEANHGATFSPIEHAKDIDGAMETLFDLHTQRWNAVGKPGIFATEQARDYYRDLAHAMYTAGSLYLATLRTEGGEAIGADFGFDHGGTRYAYTYGYRPGTAWEKASLGLVLDCLCIRNAIEAGLTRVDLMRSEGEYKKRYGAVRSDNVEVMVFRSRTAYLRVMAYRRLRATAKRLLKRH